MSPASVVTGVLTAVVLLLSFGGGFVQAQNTNFDFPNFNQTNVNISPFGDSSFDRSNPSYVMNNAGVYGDRGSCGRIMYKNPVQMVDSITGAVASFQTAFIASFESNVNATTCGDGMTFMFVEAPALTVEDYNRGGSGFCLLNFSATPPDQHVFAVEFDSYESPGPELWYDWTSAHIGVDVNNRSLATTDICAIGTMSSFCDGTSGSAGFCGQKGMFAAWIDYDSGVQKLEVRIREGNSTADALKPAKPAITVNRSTLNQVFSQNMYVGFGGSTYEDQHETHRLYSWSFSTSGIETAPAPAPAPVPSPAAPHSNKSSTLQVVAGVCGAVGGCVILGLGLLCWFCMRRRMKASEELMEYPNLGELGLPETSWEFTYRELSRITKNFSDSELLASGGFGDVFKGTLASGALVAVKRIKRRKEQDVKSFVAEATSMRQIRHRHLLQLRGWCVSKEGMLLVFDFMPNSSLDKWIHATADRPTLSWQVRRNILAGVASGLAYLHGEWVQCVLHRDIKSSNVMLDADFNAYVGDFGLARLVDHHKVDKTTLLAGTLGYMAPEMQHTGRATKETDVYAFGILMLEVVCGRRPLKSQVADPKDYVLVDCVWRAHEAGDLLSVADGSLLVMDEEGTEVETSELIKWVLHLGLLCCHPNPGERPSMRDVDHWLFSQARDGIGMEVSRLPATRPYIAHYLCETEEFSESGMISASSSSQVTSSLIGAGSLSQTSSSHPSY